MTTDGITGMSGAHSARVLARDLRIAAIVGFLTGVLSIPVVINLGLDLSVPRVLWPVIAAVLFVIALFAARLISRRRSSFFEFMKFALVGVMNTGVDFGLLNSLMLVTGVVSGAGFLAFKSLSITLGVINSYWWNKYWTFNAAQSRGARREFVAFAVVTLLAVGLNVAGAAVIVNVIGAPRGIGVKLWANIGAISGAGLTLCTNFFAYKYFVFKRPSVALGLAADGTRNRN